MAMPARDEPVEYLGVVWNFSGDVNLNGNYWIERTDDKGSHGAYVPLAAIRRINPYVTVTLTAEEMQEVIGAVAAKLGNHVVTRILRDALEQAKNPTEDGQ